MNTNFWYSSFIPSGCVLDGKVNKKKLNEIKNMQEARNTFMNLFNLALDTFEWKGLPGTCNARFLEMQLLIMGNACMYKDPSQGLQTLGFLPMEFNIYGEPSTGTAYGFFGQAKKVNCYLEGSYNDIANAVMVRDNISSYPFLNYIITYSERLSDIMRSMDTASWLLQLPYLITCEQSQTATFDALFKKVGEHYPYIPVSDALNPDSIRSINLNPNPEILRTLWDQYRNLDNEIRTFLGIQNQSNSDKKERLLVDEVNSNNEITNDYIELRLRQREKFCEDVNKFFGLNVSVSVNKSREFVLMDQVKDNKQNEKEDDNNEI